MKTIEHRISDLIEERLKQHMVKNVLLLVDSESNTPAFDAGNIVARGTYSGSYPRSFEIQVNTDSTVDISEVTLFADLGADSPLPYVDSVSFTVGTPFAISSTGILLEITDLPTVNTKYMVRMGNAFASIPDVIQHPVNFYDLNAPSLSVFFDGDAAQNLPVERTRSTMDMNIVLALGPEAVSKGDHYELLGDIRDCINRDPHLWDGTTCLSDDVMFTGSNYFDQIDRGNSYFVIVAQIVYQSKTKNARLK